MTVIVQSVREKCDEDTNINGRKRKLNKENQTNEKIQGNKVTS